jgi:phenylpropionate dioxygenase-like ring-hydroxylating dioxygenase large terminal subunit
MFDGFAEVWTPVMLARRLKAKPVRMTVAGEKLAFFRGKDGAPAALLDRCPHRGVSLSLGKVTADGCLECPFHGWQFDADGTNRHVPLDPDAKRERLFARAYPVRQIGDLLWLYTGVEAKAEPNVPPALTDDRTRNCVERTWSCHWTRAMENMLDSPHLPFVHRTTIGRPMAKMMKPDSRMVTSWEEMPWGGRQRASLDGNTNLAHLDFHRPNMMSLHIPIPGKRFSILALVIPVDAQTTRLMVVGARDFLRWRGLNPLFNLMNAYIANQDQAVVESSDPPVVPEPSLEVSVATDRPTLAFRKYYFERLSPSRADAARTAESHRAGSSRARSEYRSA